MAYSRQIGLLLLGALLFGALLSITLITVQFVRSTTVTGPSATPTPSVKPQTWVSSPLASGVLQLKTGDTYFSIAYA